MPANSVKLAPEVERRIEVIERLTFNGQDVWKTVWSFKISWFDSTLPNCSNVFGLDASALPNYSAALPLHLAVVDLK